MDRRGFLGGLFKAGVSAPAVLAAHSIGVDVATKGEDRTVFNFTCSCGAGLMAEVPKEVGEKIGLNCDCGLRWELEWAGGAFKTKMLNQRTDYTSGSGDSDV